MSSLKSSAKNLDVIRQVIRKRSAALLMKREMLQMSIQKREALEQGIKDTLKALTVAQEVAKMTQAELEVQISTIVTSAIQAIFGKPYEFKIDFQIKRGKTEADIYLMDEDGHRFNPMNDSGGGLVDVIAFTLRLACWRINNPRSANIIIYDEPLKFVSKKYLPNVAEFIKELSVKLKMQIIMVTHIEEFIETANNIIRIEN